MNKIELKSLLPMRKQPALRFSENLKTQGQGNLRHSFDQKAEDKTKCPTANALGRLSDSPSPLLLELTCQSKYLLQDCGNGKYLIGLS
jgi:hypothetical protein